ncbi:MAG: hypothetical protein ACRDKB_09010 [Actinomycetota bacterium]
MWRRRLFWISSIYLAYFIIGAIVSVAARWPAQFGGVGDPDDVAAEFLTRGTALAAPLGPMIVFALMIFLLTRTGVWEKIGTIGVMLLAILFLIGSLGEAFASGEITTPRSVLIISGIIGTVMSLIMFGAGIMAFREPRSATERVADRAHAGGPEPSD